MQLDKVKNYMVEFSTFQKNLSQSTHDFCYDVPIYEGIYINLWFMVIPSSLAN